MRRMFPWLLAGMASLAAWATDDATLLFVATEGEAVRAYYDRITPGTQPVDQVVPPAGLGLADSEPFSLELDASTGETLLIDDEDLLVASIFSGVADPCAARVTLWVEPGCDASDPGAHPAAAPSLRSGPGGNDPAAARIARLEKTSDGFQLSLTNFMGFSAAEVFAYTMEASPASVTQVVTNDDLLVVTNTWETWSDSPPLCGFSNDWTVLSTNVPLVDGAGVFTDSTVTTSVFARFYAAAPHADSDGDGLSDGQELFRFHTSPTNAVSSPGGWPDWEVLTFGMDPADNASTHFVAHGVDVAVANASRPDWDWGWSIGRNATVDIEIVATNGLGVWVVLRDRETKPETFTVTVESAYAAYRSDSTYGTNNLPIVRMLLVPTGSSPILLHVHDTSTGVATEAYIGADLAGAFMVVDVQLDVGGTPDDQEEDPGILLMDSDTHPLSWPVLTMVAASPVYGLPGTIDLVMDSPAVKAYDIDSGAEWPSVSIPWSQGFEFLTIRGYGETTCVLRAQASFDTNVCDVVRATMFRAQLEPITVEGGTPPWNPSGILLGSNATFHIDVEAPQVPDAQVVWSVLSGDVSFVGATNWGRTVQVRGDGAGPFELQAKVGSIMSPPAYIQGLVVTQRTVEVHLCIVRNDIGENAPMTEAHFLELLDGANDIFRQAGIRFVKAGPTIYTNKTAWLCLRFGDPSDDTMRHELQSIMHDTGGMEVYCVADLGSATGVNRSSGDATAGLSISSNANARTLAHELGHACGLKDIYVEKDGSDFGPGIVCGAWMPLDWSGPDENGPGYYPQEMPQTNMICRLLMFGVKSTVKADLPVGSIYGLDIRGGQTFLDVGIQGTSGRLLEH